MKPQSGFALFAPLLLGAFAAAGWLQHKPPPRLAEQARQARALAAAREALIARAANDANRPGSLPCPDQSTDSTGFANRPGDGKADMLVGNHCPSYLGRLPWITLDMPPPRDRAQETLWYVLAPGLRDDDSAEPINCSTATELNHAGHSEVAALLIAAGPPLARQERPSHTPGDYLEGWLDNSPTRTYWANTNPTNDQILIIHRDEVMAMAMRRVAQSVRHCLQSHAASSGRFPWPSPLAAANGDGWLGSRFGRIPLSQPEESAEKRLSEVRARHRNAIAALAAAGDTAHRQEALSRLASVSTWSANRLRSQRQVGETFKRLGEAATTPLTELARKIASALNGGKLPASDGSAIRQASTQTQPPLAALGEALPRYGLDALAWNALHTGSLPPPETLAPTLAGAMTELQARSTEFAALDTAQPRPATEHLLAALAAIQPALGVNLELARLIGTHGDALSDESAPIEAQLETLRRQTITETADNLARFHELPTEKNRQIAERSLAATISQARQVANALDSMTSLSGAQAATAWPMVWAAAECDFLADPSGWWHNNAWHDTVFYQASDPLTPHAGNLNFPGKHELPLLVIAAGRPLQGQHRPSARIEDYLEGSNAAGSRNGEALAPSPNFSTDQGNDRIAY
jgi:hypothetical protein